ncbi:class I SAM-dependent methyltransferase [bacterium]|nr:class I SAM-dependent methyltransferase [bacterium]
MDDGIKNNPEVEDSLSDLLGSNVGILDDVMDEVEDLPDFQALSDCLDTSCTSGAPENRDYLSPKPGMKFLDAPCRANIANHKLDKWPSTYFGVDSNSLLIENMRSFVDQEKIDIGGLWAADLAKLPFEKNFFDIASVIGVLEYCKIRYVKKVLKELRRVLNKNARMVIDNLNLKHSNIDMLFRLGKCPHDLRVYYTREAFEDILSKYFTIDDVDDSHIMVKYFVRAEK